MAIDTPLSGLPSPVVLRITPPLLRGGWQVATLHSSSLRAAGCVGMARWQHFELLPAFLVRPALPCPMRRRRPIS